MYTLPEAKTYMPSNNGDWEAQQVESARRRQQLKDQNQRERQERFARVLKSVKVDLEIQEVPEENPMRALGHYKQAQHSELDRILAEAEAATAKAKLHDKDRS